MKRKLISMMLAFGMVFNAIPVSSFAEEVEEPVIEEIQEIEMPTQTEEEPSNAKTTTPTYTYTIQGVGSQNVNKNSSCDVMSGVSLLVTDDSSNDVTTQSGCVVKVVSIKKFNVDKSVEDTDYTWDGVTSEIDTKTSDVVFEVIYQAFEADGTTPVIVNDNYVTATSDFKITSKNEVKDHLTTDDEYIIHGDVKNLVTGTAPFDTVDKAGNDTSPDDQIVRSFDSFTYTLKVSSESYTSGVGYKEGNIWYRFELPYTKEQATFDTEAMVWMSEAAGYAWNLTTENIDNTSTQVLTCVRNLDVIGQTAQNAFPCIDANVTLTILVNAMVNGETITPRAYTWMDHNDVYDNGVFNKDKVCAEHNRKEAVEIPLTTITVSSAPQFNVVIRKDAYKDYVGSFDFESGNGNALNRNLGSSFKGVMRGYSISISMENANPDKKMKGMELPDGKPISLQIDMDSLYEPKNTSSVSLNTYLWSIDDNADRNLSNFDGRSFNLTGSLNYMMNEPLSTKTTGAKTCCYNSGNWSASQSGNTLNITISDYKVDYSYFPELSKGGGAIPEYRKVFSTGKMLLVTETYKDNEYLVDKYGNGTVHLTVLDKNLIAYGKSGKTTKDTLDREQTVYNVVDDVLQAGEDKLYENFPLSSKGTATPYILYAQNFNTDWHGLALANPLSHCSDGQDTGMPGQTGYIQWGVIWDTKGNAENNVYAVDSLVLFDPEGIEALNKSVILNGSSNSIKGYGDLTYYYAALPSGTYDINRMNSIKIDELEYYDSLEALQKDGKTCVGCLMEFRATTKITLTSQNVTQLLQRIPVQIIDDTKTIDTVYPTVVKTNLWWKSDTDKYAMEHPSDPVIPSVYKDKTAYTTAVTDASWQNYIAAGKYTPSEYEDGYYARGHNNSRHTGDSIYIVPYTTAIIKHIEQTNDSGTEKYTFDMDNGQTIVDFRLEPSLEVHTTTPKAGYTTVTVKDTLPKGLIYNYDAVIGGIYTPSEKLGLHGTMSEDADNPMVNLQQGGTYKGIDCNQVNVTNNSDGSTTLEFVFKNVPYGVDESMLIGKIHYSATLNGLETKDGQQFETKATIEGALDHRAKDPTNHNVTTAGLRIIKLGSLSLLKTADDERAENGKPVSYTIHVNNTDPINASDTLIMMDTMPTLSSGSYTVEKVSFDAITYAGNTPETYEFYYTTDKKGLTIKSVDYYNGKFADPSIIDTSATNGTPDSVNGIVWVHENDLSKFPNNVTAWCAVGKLLPSAVLESKVTILPVNMIAGTSLENLFTVGPVSSRGVSQSIGRMLSGHTWIDTDQDGIRQSTEQVLPGVKATLYSVEKGEISKDPFVNLKGKVCQVNTDKDGYYEFTDLPEGEYVVRFTSGTTTLENTYKLTTKQSDGSVSTINTSKADAKETEGFIQYVKVADISNITLPEKKDIVPGTIYKWENMDAGFYSPGSPLAAEYTLHARKTLDGRDFKQGDSFTFTVDPIGNAPAFEKSMVEINPTSDTIYDFDFGKAVYPAMGDYSYTVKETKENITGIIYDTKVYTVIVHVSGKLDAFELEAKAEFILNKVNVNSILFENRYEDPSSKKTKVVVQKVWDDSNNMDKVRPNQITIHLYADGKDTGKTLVLDANNGWKGEFIELDKDKAYTVKEDTVKSYTTTITGNAQDGYIVTNTHKPKNPNTGINTGFYSWIILMSIAALGFSISFILKRRKV
ncbi:MAG: Cna B-type domain-containing protein [Holdemanella sp.]|nr:Cna B-type domain-containing protein [Holdemanella sp.]